MTEVIHAVIGEYHDYVAAHYIPADSEGRQEAIALLEALSDSPLHAKILARVKGNPKLCGTIMETA